MNTASFRIPLSRVNLFYKELAFNESMRGQRVGQAFFNYMNLGQMKQDQLFLDELHAADNDKARAMIDYITDWYN